MSYNSKYSGQQVEDLLDQVANGNAGGGGSGGITTELDPIFSASAAAKITDDNISSWNNKVDKVDGKQLSTEDFTTLLKQKLEDLSNYDDTEISQAVSKLRTDLDTLVSGDTTTAIKTFNEVIAFLDGLEDTKDLASIIASIELQIAAKGTYSKPSTGIPKSDLAGDVQTSLGKADTALQSVPEEYVTMDELDRLLSESPFEFVDLGLPSGTLWATCNIGAANPEEAGLYFAWGEIDGYKVSYTADGNVITSTTITDKDGNATDKKFSAEHYKWCNGSLDNLTKYNYDTDKGVVDNLNQLVLVDDAVYAVDRHSRMPSVADFEELIANTTFSKVAIGNQGCGKFTAANGKYVILPVVGRVNAQGITGVNAWAVYPTREIGGTNPSDCEVMYFTSSYSPRIDTESRDIGLPVRAVKNKLYGNDDYYYTKEEIDAQKQDKLVSAQNIKTINGMSILGSGNLVIEGGGGSSGGGESSNARKEVVYDGGVPACLIVSMRPNVVYWLESVENVTIDSFEEPLQGVDSYDIFTVVMSLESLSNNDVSLTLPDNVLWANGQIPDLTMGDFELSISRISDGDLAKYSAVLTPFKPI